MIAERIEANVLQASIPGEEASEWWGQGGICVFPPGYLPREESQKERRNTCQVQEFTWVYVCAVEEATCPHQLLGSLQ